MKIKPSPKSLLIQDCPNCGQEVNREFIDNLTVEIKKEAILDQLRGLVEWLEGRKINEKGNIEMNFGENNKHLIEVDSNRAVFYNSALQDIKNFLLSEIKIISGKK
ncbi:MAG: hypothetical protein NUV97_02940 [archaeon]|nr:hypothetical protein [archaeon]